MGAYYSLGVTALKQPFTLPHSYVFMQENPPNAYTTWVVETMNPHRIYPWIDDDRSVSYWILLLGTPLVLALAAALYVPFYPSMPHFYFYALEYIRTGHIVETTYPLEYAWLAGLSMKAAGQRGLELMQTAIYSLTVLSVWALARKIGTQPRYALLAGLLTAIYPQLPVSVTKLWDVDYTIFLMIMLMLCIVSLTQGIQIPLVIGSGIVFGCGMAQRPNMILMLPLVVYAIFVPHASWYVKARAVAVGGAISASILIAINILAHGSFFLPQNGPYNFVQGANEFSIQTMLRDQNPEQSVPLFMRADGIDPRHFDEADPKLQRYFVNRGLYYARNHPLEEARIIAVKLFVFLSPNEHVHHGLSVWSIPILAMASVIPVWLILLLLKLRDGTDLLDRIFIVAAVLYILPFLLTASDPRYQYPLDIMLFAHIAKLLEDRAHLAEERIGSFGILQGHR